MKIEIQNSEDCKKLSIDQLAEIRPHYNNSPGAVLIDNEIDRKQRMYQHKLDKELIEIQSKSMKVSYIVSAICTIAGAIAGALIIVWLQ